MKLRKWNCKKHEYEPYEVPDDWKVRTFCSDMNEIINCAQCGAKLEFGDTYTSRQVHTAHGVGYGVCQKCYEKEVAKERRTWPTRSAWWRGR